MMSSSYSSSIAHQFSCFSSINTTRLRLYTHNHSRFAQFPSLRSHVRLSVTSDGGNIGITNSQTKTTVSYTPDASTGHINESSNSYASAEEIVNGKETTEALQEQTTTESKKTAKIHDFCLGIPFGGIVLTGGLLGFILTRNISTLGTGVLFGGALLALSTFSLKVWRHGELAFAGARVVLYEKEDYLGGGFANAVSSISHGGIHDIDLNFMVVNPETHPNVCEFFKRIKVYSDESDFSFSVSLDGGDSYEWGTRNGISSLFAQKSNTMNIYFWKMLREINKFRDDALRYLEDVEQNLDTGRMDNLDHFVKTRGYSDLFQKAYLVPICSSVWSNSLQEATSLSAYSVLSFFRDNYLLEPFGNSQGLVIRWKACNFINKIRRLLEGRGCEIRRNTEVHCVTTSDDGCVVACDDGSQERYDECIMATHASDALKLLGKQATHDETRVLGAFQYVQNDVFLHRDKRFLPLSSTAWSTCNFHGTSNKKWGLTYSLNALQSGSVKEPSYLVTLNPYQEPEHTLFKWSNNILLPTIAASKSSLEFDNIQGKRRIWFCKPYHGNGFNTDALKAGIATAHSALGKSFTQLSHPKHIIPSTLESGARILATRFFKNYISSGCLILLEEGGTIFTFKGSDEKCSLKTTLIIHNPQFYWKIATEADLGLADAYIQGDFSLLDGNEGLLNLFMILIANRAVDTSSKMSNKRGWWTPSLYTASIASAKFFFKHLRRQNTITQARRNISRHYDLSNEMFALFLDETMTYSCAVFHSDDEDLKDAQLRKISLLIEKARIKKEHEVLEIGCGWGSLAIEVVKRTGCKYTGITLSEEQLRLAEAKVKESGLQDRIKFLLCDYRELSSSHKYDRIISCGMLEHVGHEYIDEFFGGCESLLAEDGILVLQFISYPDSEYHEYRRSAGFIKEYIFPGGCLPSLSRVTQGMASSSRLCVEHVENIGIHYHQTLRCWRKNFLENKSKIMGMGFDEKFIRTWEYYFDYCAAGFKSRMLGDYQMVFSRPGNLAALSDPYKGFPSAYK